MLRGGCARRRCGFGMYKVVTAGFSPRAVFLLVPSGQGARHLGRYGTEGQLCCLFMVALVVFSGTGMCVAGFLGDDLTRLCSLLWW